MFSGQNNLPCSPERSPYSDPRRPYTMEVDQPAQHYKSALFQVPAGSSPAHSAYDVEGLNRHFTHNANSFDTLESVGYPTARSPTPAPEFYPSPQQFPLCDASNVPRFPNPESIYDFRRLARRTPSPEVDHYSASTRLPEVDGNTVPALPEAKGPARISAEPVVFRNPFRSVNS